MVRACSGMILPAFLFLVLFKPLCAWGSDEEARTHLVRGMAAIEMAKGNDELAAAAEEFKKAAEIAPAMAAAWYNLGSVQVKLGQLGEAVESYKKYVALAPQADDARKIRDEIIKLEYRLERQNLAEQYAGIWSDPEGQTFQVVLNGSRLQVTRGVQHDYTCILRSMGTSYPNGMNIPPLVFSGTLVGDKFSGQFLQPSGNGALQTSAECVVPEHKGAFEGTVDIAAGRMQIIYTRVKMEYLMEFKSFLSDEFVCRRTSSQEIPGFVLKLTRAPQPTPRTGK